MKKTMKWLGIIVGALIVIIVLALLIAPLFVEKEQFITVIENTVEEATGRSFELGGESEFSLFPWAGISLEDVSLGNADGFETGSFAEFSKFEIRMKLLPLIFREVQVKHVVLKGLRVVLEKTEDGNANWVFNTAKEGEKVSTKEIEGNEKSETLPIKKLDIGEISVTDGSILYIDNQSDVRKEISDVDIHLENISLDAPIDLSMSGKLDEKPFSLEGNVGPIGENPGEGDVGLDLIARAFDVVILNVNGTVSDPAASLAYRLNLSVEPFSPKLLVKELSPEMELSLSDTETLNQLTIDVDIAGNTEKVSLSNGRMVIDDTSATFEITAKEFSKPNIAWKIHLDRLDLDRYLPESGKEKATAQQKEQPADVNAAGGEKDGGEKGENGIDYTSLRRLVVDGHLEVDELKSAGGTFTDIMVNVKGADGIIDVDPISMNLYEGSMQIESSLDITGKEPKTTVTLALEGVEIEPLINDFLEKDLITGSTKAQISLSMTGDAPEQIKKTLNGNGNLQFIDGKIKKINLIGMIQNLQAAFGSGTAGTTQETEFSEIVSLFTIENGLVSTSETEVTSPVLRVDVTGSADLVKESLDFRVNPTYINPKNQKESGISISGNQVPVLVTGTFAKPKFRPDLETAAKKVVTEKLTEKLGEVLGGSKTNQQEENGGDGTEQSESLEDSVKGILKNLPFGR